MSESKSGHVFYKFDTCNTILLIHYVIYAYPLFSPTKPVLTNCDHNIMNRSGDPMNVIARVQDNSTEIRIRADARIRTPDPHI
jgi:hypothetical protein